MKILQVIPSYKPAYVYGGPIQSVSALCEGLAAAGHDVTVYTTNANGRDDLDVETGKKYSIEGVSVYYFKRITGDHSNISPSLLWQLWRTVSSFDVVHVQSWWNLVAMPAALICLVRGIRPVISPRGSLTDYTFSHRRQGLKRMLHALGGKWLLTRSLIHVTSVREEVDVLRTVPRASVRILPNILELPKAVPVEAKDRIGFQMLFLGRIDPKKRLDFLIRVLQGLDTVPWRLRIVGSGDPGYLATLMGQGGNDPRISWDGPIYGEEKWRIYAAADLVALPSHNENYGNVIVEALSQGTPVLLSDQVGTLDWVAKNRLGWTAESNEQAWRDTINRIWSENGERQRIRREGPECVRRDFDPGMLANQYITLYESPIA